MSSLQRSTLIVIVYFENRSKQLNSLCGQNTEFRSVKAGGSYSNHKRELRGKLHAVWKVAFAFQLLYFLGKSGYQMDCRSDGLGIRFSQAMVAEIESLHLETIEPRSSNLTETRNELFHKRVRPSQTLSSGTRTSLYFHLLFLRNLS